ncbi:hypothetical protein CKAH01_09951 [Colletotrichum kahawae]|uniref:Uncharacterized protein n=1 Tax=Colletotrichum kahawae TaxID=34407 RepID=A0AAD9Y0F5_COLKA|nr:hypothetical protein CKAH01_09951 [Colletotrichum kahawae]
MLQGLGRNPSPFLRLLRFHFFSARRG